MPNYDIVYTRTDGSVADKIQAVCADDHEAKILAHALKKKGFLRIKVRTGAEHRLIYQRPAAPCG